MARLDALSAPAGEVPLDPQALLRARVRGMFSYNVTSLAGHAVGALVIGWVFWNVAPARLLATWGGVFAVVWIARVAYALWLARHKPADIDGLRRRLRTWVSGTLVTAALWGWAGWAFYPHGDALQQIVLVLVVYTFCVACVPVLAPQQGVYLGFVGLVFLPVIARVGLEGGVPGLQAAVLMFTAMAMTVVLGRDYRRGFETLTRLRLRTEALKQEAEIANRAKTQFFTAASHDLRQPLHAMGLFAEALRQRVHEPEVANLVNSINQSVDALEELFSELLDINRIDSGRIEVHPEHFRVDELLRKLRLHFEPSAFEKGLALRLRGAHHVVHADPLLVERIARNLVSNAIRYTEDGTVLVSCRRRNARVQLQVWDTGAGIAPADLARIFEEFYQVNSAAATGEQRKGLGLGLAIVQRLAALMGTPLTVRSEVGRGTVFTLDLPGGRVPRVRSVMPPGKPPLALTLDGRRIVMVEDEPAVRGGLEVLLRGWGAEVLSFESVAACRAWAAQAAADEPAPDLVIADWRLEGGSTGVEAIRAVRERFGARVPAIVVTGSTMSGHDREAQENDFHLLVKPVVPNKLRAMIGFKLGVKAL